MPPDESTAAEPPGEMQFKACDWEVKAIDDEGRFSVYFAAFGNVDRGGDVCEAGCFKNVEDFNRDGWIGINHQMEQLPVAYPIRAVQDSKGLLVDGRFHSTPEAQACRMVVKERMAAGKGVKGSIGYKVRDGGATQEWLDGKAIRRLKAVDIFEASFVNLPMNPKADALSAKSSEGLNVSEKIVTIEALKAWFDTETKAGRAFSKTNHAKLKGYATGLDEHGKKACAMAKEMHDFLDAYDPDAAASAGEPDGDEKTTTPPPPPKVGAMGAAVPEAKDPMDPRRIAGNAALASDVPGGAQTAQNMKSLDELRAHKEKLISDVRARALRAHIQFALVPERR